MSSPRNVHFAHSLVDGGRSIQADVVGDWVQFTHLPGPHHRHQGCCFMGVRGTWGPLASAGRQAEEAPRSLGLVLQVLLKPVRERLSQTTRPKLASGTPAEGSVVRACRTHPAGGPDPRTLPAWSLLARFSTTDSPREPSFPWLVPARLAHGFTSNRWSYSVKRRRDSDDLWTFVQTQDNKASALVRLVAPGCLWSSLPESRGSPVIALRVKG